MDLQLTDKTALITAGTGGIGLEIARSLAAEGARVFITGRTAAKLDAAREDIRESCGADVTPVLADAGTEAGAATIIGAVPTLDVLVNNLGIYESRAFTEISDEQWAKLFEINVISGVRLSRAYLPSMLERNWGRIIFISSESGLVVPPDMIHYATTKSAQLSIARGLAQLTRGTQVTVNSVLPGPTRSAGVLKFLRSQAEDSAAPIEQIEAQFFAKERSTSILQRMIEAQEIANLVSYVASPRSSATNGASLRAEGGLINTIA